MNRSTYIYTYVVGMHVYKYVFVYMYVCLCLHTLSIGAWGLKAGGAGRICQLDDGTHSVNARRGGCKPSREQLPEASFTSITRPSKALTTAPQALKTLGRPQTQQDSRRGFQRALRKGLGAALRCTGLLAADGGQERPQCLSLGTKILQCVVNRM